ncbi:MAG TPA: DUF484 family protein [Burkholderiales bacterium]|nr:DUF484 family protein [Burkholderiales bacterium]
MSPDDVAGFLRTHPQFFDEHPELLESIYVPHPHGGRAIALSERQILGLRDKAKTLEAKLAELIRVATENDAIAEKVHRLALALIAARDFTSTVQAVYFHLREDFAVPHVALRVWGKAVPAGTPEGVAVDPELRSKVESLGAPQCGPAVGSPFADWFGEAKEHVRSLALVPLGQTRAFGLLAFGAEDPQRFYAEMGTLYLRRIGDMVGGALAARL